MATQLRTIKNIARLLGLVRQVNQTRLYGTVWGGTQAFKVEVPESRHKIITDSYMQRYDREPTTKEVQEIYNAKM